jgi:hypothetical protein
LRASLDTNAIIHFYRAGLEGILFDLFDDGVFIYEQIREIELENHAADLLEKIDMDIAAGKIRKYTDNELKEQSVYSLFLRRVHENRMLYNPGDLGEVYAISLAQTIGAYSLVTDDTKQGGPYMSLLQFEDDVMPFNFADILLVRYLIGMADEHETLDAFNRINSISQMNWSFRSQIGKFIRRFWNEPYRQEDTIWMDSLIEKYHIKVKTKFVNLRKLI